MNKFLKIFIVFAFIGNLCVASEIRLEPNPVTGELEILHKGIKSKSTGVGVDGNYDGVDDMTVSSASNVGIGTTSPSAKLDVVGNTELTGTLTTSGNVGIGTTDTSAAKLTVAGDVSVSGTGTFDALAATGSGANYFIGNIGVGTSTPSSLLDLQQAGTAKAVTDMFELTNSGNAVDMDGTGSGILFNQWYYSATTPAVADAGRISVVAEQDWTSTTSTQDSALILSTALNGTVAEKMRITSAGNVGIGTTVPSGKFSVASLAAQDIYFFYDNDDVADGVDGQSLWIYRRAAESDRYLKLFVNQFEQPQIAFNGDCSINGGFILRLQPAADGNVSFFDASASGKNRFITIGGYITAASASRFVKLQVNDSTDNFEMSREDANIGKFDIQMPLQTDGYYSTDGSQGVTVTTCSSFKDGLCVAGT